MPPGEELILCDDGYSFDVPVPAGAGSQLQLGDVATGVVDDQALRLTDAAHLALARSAMRQWVEGAGT